MDDQQRRERHTENNNRLRYGLEGSGARQPAFDYSGLLQVAVDFNMEATARNNSGSSLLEVLITLVLMLIVPGFALYSMRYFQKASVSTNLI